MLAITVTTTIKTTPAGPGRGGGGAAKEKPFESIGKHVNEDDPVAIEELEGD